MRKAFILFIAVFVFVVVSQVSWAGTEGRVKCGETAEIYTNLLSSETSITILATDKCSGLDSAIIYSDGIERRITIPDGQSRCVTVRIGSVNYPNLNFIKLECNGTNPKGYCTFVIVDVK